MDAGNLLARPKIAMLKENNAGAGAWKSACKAAGCPGGIPHDFRRTAVRNLERAGVARSVAMQMVGHKTEAIYRLYAIVNETDLQEAGVKLALMAEKDQAVKGNRDNFGDNRQSAEA